MFCNTAINKLSAVAAALAVLVIGSAAIAASFPLDIRLEGPAAGACELRVVESDAGPVWSVVAVCDGSGLPGEDSIVAVMDAPEAEDIFVSRVIPTDRHWTVPRWPRSFSSLPELSQYALWRESGGRFGVMANATGGGMIAYLSGSRDGVAIKAQSYDDGFGPRAVPLFTIGFGDDPYELTSDVYAHALAVMRDTDPKGVIGRLRVEKDYPEILGHLGWCSWNAYYTEVTAEGMAANARSFKEADFPVRWMIIDDGWHTISVTEAKSKKKRGMSLASFKADPGKFPGGLAALTRTLKEDYGIEWVGAWHTLHGYWNGVAADSEISRSLPGAFMEINDTVLLADPRSDAGFDFWDAFHQSLKSSGIDFVKTDDQSTMFDFTKDIIPIGQAYAGNQINFQRSAGKHFDDNVINCMDMSAEAIYQWKTTNVSRVSRDYYPLPPHNPRAHTVDCVMNSMWFAELAYPDYDMWQTHEPHADYHAVARAISGGPVYFTDEAGREDFSLLWPLILSDGRIIRMDEPARPTRDSLFRDAYMSLRALSAEAPAGGGGAVATWNVNRFELPVGSEVSPSDVRGIEGDEFACFEFFSGELKKLGFNDTINARLSRWETRLYSFMPVRDGFAPLGLVEKYVPPATVADYESAPGRARVTLLEAGLFGAWAERRPTRVTANGDRVADDKIVFEGNFLRVDLGPGAGEPAELVIEW